MKEPSVSIHKIEIYVGLIEKEFEAVKSHLKLSGI
jgi:hypothetical protein